MLGILILFLMVAVASGSLYSMLVYQDGAIDGRRRGSPYDNEHRGYAAWLYDLGYNSVEARKDRAAANAAHNKARQEGRK